MNTLLIAPELFATEGGIARILRLYLKAMCEQAGEGEHVGFLALNDRFADSEELRRYSTPRLSEWQVCSRDKSEFVLGTFKMTRHADLVICGHVAQLPVAWLASLARRRLRYVLVAHGIEVWRPFTFLEKRALKGASRILCVSEYTRGQVLSRCHLDPARVVVLHNALDPKFEPKEPAAPPGDAKLILTVSRLSSQENYKGIDHLIEAMPSVTKQVPGARLRVVGRGDGLRRLQDLVRRVGAKDSVEFAGFVQDSEMHAEFSKCHIFALPSEKEGFGLVYVEAMAHGRPCLVARSGGAPEVVSEETGLLVPYGDVGAIAAALVEGLRREWPVEPLVRHSQTFSYLRFKERLASVLKE